LVNAQVRQALGPEALVNVARGTVVDKAALCGSVRLDAPGQRVYPDAKYPGRFYIWVTGFLRFLGLLQCRCHEACGN
jgi:hypothetical protein